MKKPAAEDKKVATMPKKPKGKRTSGVCGETTEMIKGIMGEVMSPHPTIIVGSYDNWPTDIDRNYDAWYACIANMKLNTLRVYTTEEEFNKIVVEARVNNENEERKDKND